MFTNHKIKLTGKVCVQKIISKLKYQYTVKSGTGVNLPNVFPRDFQFPVISLESGIKC